MNDECSGQLTGDWAIPRYARDMLWLESETGVVQAEGEHGLFTLPEPAPHVNLHWGGPEGVILAQLPWQADNLDWDGTIGIGGYVDAIHMTDIDDVRSGISIVYLGGQPLRRSVAPFPAKSETIGQPHSSPDFHNGLVSELGESVTTWLVYHETPLAELTRRALLGDVRVYLFGHLADDKSGWANYFSLPIMLRAVTLFSP